MYPVSSLTVLTMPQLPLQTVEGLAPKLDGCTVRLDYADGYTLETEATGAMVPPESYAVPGTWTTHLEYGGAESEEVFTISVAEKSLLGLHVAQLPYLTSYVEGEELDTWGLRVVLLYDNGTEEEVYSWEITGGYDGTIGVKTVTVSYQDMTATFTVEVCACLSIELTELPEKNHYVQGQPLDPLFGEFRATLSNGDVRNFDLSWAELSCPPDGLGDVQVTVSFKGCTATYDIYVNPRVAVRMSLRSEPTKKVYFVGDEIDPTGGVIYVRFVSDDGYWEEIPITEDMLSGFDSTKAGICTVTVSYCGMSVEFTVRVRDYELAATHDGETLSVSVGAIPANSVVLVVQYDIHGRLVACRILTGSGEVSMEETTHSVFMYLVDGDTFVPYLRPIEVKKA